MNEWRSTLNEGCDSHPRRRSRRPQRHRNLDGERPTWFRSLAWSLFQCRDRLRSPLPPVLRGERGRGEGGQYPGRLPHGFARDSVPPSPLPLPPEDRGERGAQVILVLKQVSLALEPAE